MYKYILMNTNSNTSVFISRVLDIFRCMREARHWHRIGPEFRKDLDWWWTFLDYLSHESCWCWTQTPAYRMEAAVSRASSLPAVSFHRFVLDRFWHINTLELRVLFLALRLWAPKFQGLKLKFFSYRFRWKWWGNADSFQRNYFHLRQQQLYCLYWASILGRGRQSAHRRSVLFAQSVRSFRTRE